MCWNWEVSLLFATAETLCILFVLNVIWNFPANYKKKHLSDLPYYMQLHLKRIWWLFPFIISINLVEWSEVGIWLSDPAPMTDLIADQNAACAACSRGNFFFTSLAGFAIGFQPVVTMIFLHKTHCASKFYKVLNLPSVTSNPTQTNTDQELGEISLEQEQRPGNNFIAEMQKAKVPIEDYLQDNEAQKAMFHASRDLFKITYVIGIIFTVSCIMAWLCLTLFSSFQKCDYDDSVFATMAAACTCSYEGKYGHLVWTFMFPCKIREYMPTIFDYLMLANVAPLFYGPCWAAMPMVGSFIFFIFEMIYYMGSPEVYSVWCWTGVGAVGLHVFYALLLYDERLFKQLESTGMNGSCIEVLQMFYYGFSHAMKASKPVQELKTNVKRKLRRLIFLR